MQVKVMQRQISRPIRALAIVLMLALLGSQARGADIRGRARVVDGDTIEINHRSIGLFGIEAPLPAQTCFAPDGRRYACGQAARQVLDRLVGIHEIACSPRGSPNRLRLLAVCRVGDIDLAAAMVERGWALARWRDSLDYVDLENSAREARRGIWAGTFMAPEEFRKLNEREPYAPFPFGR